MSNIVKIDEKVWMAQPRMLAERCRGLPLIWTPDVNWFNNDWLGPTTHVHDNATEIAYMAQGSLEIEVGGSKRVYKQGDFIMMPPKKYHNYWLKRYRESLFFRRRAQSQTYCVYAQRISRQIALRVMRHLPTCFRLINCRRTNIFCANGYCCNQGKANPRNGSKHRIGSCISLAEPRTYRLTCWPGHWLRIGTCSFRQRCPIKSTTRVLKPFLCLSLTITDPFTAHGTALEE